MSASAPRSPTSPTADPNSPKKTATNGTNRERVLRHISDLQAEALTGFNPQWPIKTLITNAENGVIAANRDIQFRRPDNAFVEYMRAHELTTNVIPRHPNYIDLMHDDKNGEQRLKVLRGKLFAAHEQFMKIKSIIENDNARCGTVPASKAANGYAKDKPIPAPKPSSMHGHSLSQSTPKPAVDLESRFSKLRLNTTSLTSLESSDEPSSTSTLQKTPASMNGPPPTRPAKVPLDDIVLSLPKPPSPTYSPARNMDTNGHIALPRHTARSLAGNDIRRSLVQTYSPQSTKPLNGSDDSYFPPSINGAILGSAPRRTRSIGLDDVKITAERLYDYLARFSVLLIDVRPRQDYDQGHIFARNIMCIEPMTLRQGMSAEQVHETLVLSPDREQLLWDDRNMFDLVVYYDQQSQGLDERLQYLHEALWEFNQDKALKAVPKLLIGGIDAWCDIAGSQSLMVSNTAASRSTGIQRRPLATASGRSELRVPKRRLRDYNPLDKDEEQKWLERARQESISVPKPPILDEDDLDASGNAAIEEFLQRFPEAGAIDRPAAYTSTPPVRQPPPPPKIPEYPQRPASSHQAPTRPAPAAPRMSYNGVSDRTAPPLPRTNSLAPYVPPKYNPINLRLPRTGLVNFGVTCYMNATLQALSATVPLSVFFIDDGFRRSVQKDNWKGSKGVMPELYSTVIRSLWAGDVESIKPTTFRNFCGRLNREWSIDRQQDAKEFFDFLVDCLHEDLNSEWSKQPYRALTEAEEQRREAMPKGVVSKVEWDRYTHREQSLLTQLFGGQHASKLKCTTCGFTSTTYEAFYSLSVEIPPRANGVTLDECLKSYCAEEMLSGDEVWKCPHCRREREATKQITLTRAPQFLVIHFKRFAAGQNGTRKVRTPIDFPLQGLDLEPYMLPPTSPDVLEKYAKLLDARALQSDLSTRPPYIYDAYAVMRHIGTTLTSGHYTCAVKDSVRGTWRMFNDTRVGDFDPAQLSRNVALNNEEAYIVFYQRRV